MISGEAEKERAEPCFDECIAGDATGSATINSGRNARWQGLARRDKRSIIETSHYGRISICRRMNDAGNFMSKDRGWIVLF
jgi:hypothetical protein